MKRKGLLNFDIFHLKIKLRNHLDMNEEKWKEAAFWERVLQNPITKVKLSERACFEDRRRGIGISA